jgi:hypothetical protein
VAGLRARRDADRPVRPLAISGARDVPHQQVLVPSHTYIALIESGAAKSVVIE